MHGDSAERAEKLRIVFGGAGSSVNVRDPFMSRWPISPKRLTPGLLAHERWLAKPPRTTAGPIRRGLRPRSSHNSSGGGSARFKRRGTNGAERDQRLASSSSANCQRSRRQRAAVPCDR